LVASFLSLLLLVGAALGVVVAMFAAHRRAQAAADLAALAAAVALVRGQEPCPAARRIATANDAEMTGCVPRGMDVVVEVRVVGPRWLGQTADLTGRARAGPS
jgi:secretion/DNA translocation related TadE-like protein